MLSHTSSHHSDGKKSLVCPQIYSEELREKNKPKDPQINCLLSLTCEKRQQKLSKVQTITDWKHSEWEANERYKGNKGIWLQNSLRKRWIMMISMVAAALGTCTVYFTKY